MIKTCITIAAIAMASSPGAAFAQAGQESFTIEFHYNAKRSAAGNYSTFARKAASACAAPGVRPLALKIQEQDCIDDVMNKLVARLGRADIAAIHQRETGRPAVLSQDLAAR